VTRVDPTLRLDEFDYDLPGELIAQTPLADRAASRLLVVDPDSGLLTHSAIRSLPQWLRPGDLIVANNTRVMPARLRAAKSETGARIELLLLHRDGDGLWTALARPAKKLRAGMRLALHGAETDEIDAVDVVGVGRDGEVTVRFKPGVEARLDAFGETPLPPYIKTRLDDPERYQTTYATEPGSAAAPTAGLHVTPELRSELTSRGIGWAELTLHVGLDTFRPVTVERVADHAIHTEWQRVSQDTAEAIAATRRSGGRVIALGTTAARALESLGREWRDEAPAGESGWTDVFITPGYQWTLVDGLITNFHLPKSTLLMLVSALAGSDRIKAAYRAAVSRRYRFFSFGDAMLILPGPNPRAMR
jgi:S-adenosylmethionine:tRNA ribosyltransferase-isomerase